ncbi:MAG: hypothetical protein R3Y09_00675 [Clostridia bacterium]
MLELEKEKSHLEYLQMFEKHVHEIETHRLESKNFQENVNNLLYAIMDFYQGDRAYIIEVDWDLHLGSNTFELCDDGIESQKVFLTDLNMIPFPRWKRAATTRESIITLDINELLETEKEEYDILHSQGINNFIVVPLNNKISGFVGVDNPKRFQDKPNFLRALSYAVASEVKEHHLSNTNKHKMESYPIKSENEIILNFCGGFEIITSLGAMNEMSIKSDLTCQLIAYLFFNFNQKISNSKLIDILWPNETSDNPIQSLRQLVYRSKKILSQILDGDIVISTPLGYELNPNYTFRSDVKEFENLCTQGNAASDSADKVEYYRQAIDMYTGSFLPRYENLSWIMNYSTFLHGMFMYAVKTCIADLKKSESFLEIHRLTTYALQFDEEDGELNYTLIEVLQKQRNFSIATKHYYKKMHLLTDEQRSEFEKNMTFLR